MNRFEIPKKWKKFLNESRRLDEMSQGGFDYEEAVIASIIEAGIVGNITSGAGASAAAADADIKIDGRIHKIEVKLDRNAQMGGTSLRYYPQGNNLNQKFSIVSKAVDPDTVDLMEESLDSVIPDLNAFLDFIGAKHFPMTTTKEMWRKAVLAGLLKPLNVKIRQNTDFIINHYTKKGIPYIQIGGAGLFYLRSNPANLPIPQLDGAIDIELRPGRSGSRTNKDGVEVCGGGIRVQGRLKFKGESPYTLDDPDSIREMLEQRQSVIATSVLARS